MVLRPYTLEAFGCIEAMLDCSAIHPDELVVSAVYDAHVDPLSRRDLLCSPDFTERTIARAVRYAAINDPDFISRLWTDQCEREDEERWERGNRQRMAAE